MPSGAAVPADLELAFDPLPAPGAAPWVSSRVSLEKLRDQLPCPVVIPVFQHPDPWAGDHRESTGRPSQIFPLHQHPDMVTGKIILQQLGLDPVPRLVDSLQPAGFTLLAGA